MKKIITTFCVLVLSGCNFLGQGSSTNLSTSEAEDVIKEAFLNSSEDVSKNKLDAEVNFEMIVYDNENNVLPTALEAARAGLKFNYDYKSDEDFKGGVDFSLSFNESSSPDFAFNASLEEKLFTFELTNITKNAVLFFGLDTLFGDVDTALNALKTYENATKKAELSDAEYADIIQSIVYGAENSDLVSNTEEQEEAINKAFLENNVLVFKGGEKTEDGYLLDFHYSPENLVKFLNKVGEINNVEIDFSNELDIYKQIQVNGKIKIDSDKNLISSSGEIFVSRSLFQGADKDLVLEYNYLIGKEGSFDLKLIDSTTNETTAKVEIDWVLR